MQKEKPTQKKKGKNRIASKATKEIERELKESSVKITTEKYTEFTGLDGKKYKLTLKQKMFCLYYLEFSGNGMEAIIEAGYNVRNSRGNINYKLAKSMACENLTKPYIIAFINKKLKDYGFDDDNVAKQHLFLINQFSDLGAKAKGIDMYYKKKGDYAEDKNQNKFNSTLEQMAEKMSKMIP